MFCQINQKVNCQLKQDYDYMAERILRPLTAEGRVTIPKELRKKHNLKDYVEILDTEDGILIKVH